MKKISLHEVLRKISEQDYHTQYTHVLQLIDCGHLKPVKASGTNGKKPALYREYWIMEQEETVRREALLEELEYRLHPGISIDYYRKHPDSYEQDRHWVLLLSNYMKENQERLREPVSCNERSFDIWQREKFLLKEQGKKILSRCGLAMEDLNIYETAEPFSYYVNTRKVPQNLLIVENKDTFYSMRRALLEGKETLVGVEIGTLIYGAGKGIWRSFQEFNGCAEPYMKAPDNHLLYFGDLDYEGILIYEKLTEVYPGSGEITPFIEAYEKMLSKSEELVKSEKLTKSEKKVKLGSSESLFSLPETKEGQNRNISGRFFEFFSNEISARMKKILESGHYIPQEILNRGDL